jgi:hypothetical protein
LSVAGIEGDESISYRRTNAMWPKGTNATVKMLDDLGVPTSLGRGKVRKLLRETADQSGDKPEYHASDTLLNAAIRSRRNQFGTPPK